MRALSILALFALTAALAADAPTVEPKELAASLAGGSKPAIFQVGFAYLYRADHIPGAIYAGPASRASGLDLLKEAASKLPRDREIVIYCGCCPWDKCPNIKPAVDLLKNMGFSKVAAMHVPASFKADWVDQRYPVEHGEAGAK
jgi:hypothetical protein